LGDWERQAGNNAFFFFFTLVGKKSLLSVGLWARFATCSNYTRYICMYYIYMYLCLFFKSWVFHGIQGNTLAPPMLALEAASVVSASAGEPPGGLRLAGTEESPRRRSRSQAKAKQRTAAGNWRWCPPVRDAAWAIGFQ
jgi:hypothetical protein